MSRLVYVMGPSGSGKDTLMNTVRAQLPPDAPVLFAHRYITRPADAGGENHVALSRAEFDLRLRHDLFALHWESHGFAYGIGREIDLWLECGCTVVMNGSREALPQVIRHYPEPLPVLINVPEAILRERLLARGRESSEAIEARLERARLFTPDLPGLIRFVNVGSLEDRAQELQQLILQTTR